MGNLSNLYISRSFQSLIHLGSDNVVTSSLTLLQDGLGNSIGVAVNNTGDLFLSGSLTASLQQGYAWVGNASGKSAAIPTSSFGGGGSIPAGTISSSAQITALGFVSSSVTASSLITASFDNGTRNLTFTKGNNTTFAVNIPDVSGSAGNFVTTSSFNAYTQSNDQRVSSLETNSASVNISISNINTTTASLLIETQNLELFSASALVSISNLNTATASLLIETQNLELFSASALTSLSNLNTATASLFTSASLALYTASVSGTTMTFTKGDASTFSVTLPTGSGGGGAAFPYTGSAQITGSLGLTGSFEINDNVNINTIITPISGTLLLTAKSFTPSSSIISAVTNSVNIAFKSSTGGATNIISGSNNIFSIAGTTAGFNRFLSNGNVALNNQPNISASMAFPVVINLNYLTNAITVRGPVSSSAYTLSNNIVLSNVLLGTAAGSNFEKALAGASFSTNYIGGSTNIIATKTPLSASVNFNNNIVAGGATALAANLNSSSVNANSNLIIGGAQINSDHTNNTATQATLLVQSNAFIGSGNIVQSNGLATANRQLFASMMVGNGNTIRLEGDGTGGSVNSTILLGESLLISGSTVGAGGGVVGTTIVGRYNSTEASQIDAGRVVFAVGTGTGVGTRRTTLLIDSGSNAIVSGSLFISGTAFLNGVSLVPTAANTGSLLVTASFDNGTRNLTFTKGDTTTFAVNIPDVSGSTINTGSFATTGSNAFNGNQTITGSLIVSGSTTLRGNTTFIDRAGTPNNNVYLGSNALLSNTTGGNNVAIGNSALQNNTTGNNNFALGVNSLNSNVQGNLNVAIGGESGQNASGSSNIFIGGMSGKFITGSANTIIGAFTGTAGTTLDNNIIFADGVGNARAQYSGSGWSFQNDIKFNKGSNKTCDIVTVNASLTVSNSLVTANSIILVTCQDRQNQADEYPPVVGNKTTGAFDIFTNVATDMQVAYLIINPTA
jgi:hypothetical protein